MVRSFLAALMVMAILPVGAHGASWFFNTQAKNSGGYISSRNMQYQTSTAGSLFKSYTTHAQLPVTVAANVGYTIRDVTVNGVSNPNPPSPFTTTVQGFNQQTVTATFLVNTLSVTASAGYGGSVTPTSVGGIYYGSTVASTMRFTFIPISRYNVAAITGVPAGATVSTPLPAPANTAVTVTFPIGYVFTSNVALAGTFTGPPVAVIANPGTVLPGGPVTLDGTGSTGAISSWSWTQISGPVKLFPDGTQGSTITVTPNVVGTYGIQLTVTGGSVATANLIVTDDPAAAARTQCQNCHQANGVGASVGVFGHWSSSTHRAKMVLCTTCHFGTGPISHPGAYTSGMVSETTFNKTYGGDNFCLNGTCHNPGVTHKTVGMACAYCHNSGDLHYPDTSLANAMSRNVCFNCHGAVNTTHYFTKVTLANDCVKCHNNGWDPHAQTKATFFPVGVVVPPAHFNGYTSYVNPGYAAAYVTATTSCSDCHKGGDPNDPLDRNSILKQYRDDWAGSGHGDVKAVSWLNSASHNWKASGEAGVKVSQAGAATDCQRCHTATGYVQFTSFSTINPIATGGEPYSEPLTCNGCHNPDFTVRTISQPAGYHNYSSTPTGKVLVSASFPDNGPSSVCLGCHAGREAGSTIKAMAAQAAFNGYSNSFWANVDFVDSHYLAAAGEVFGTVGYEYSGAYTAAVNHAAVGAGADGACVTCHMETTTPGTHSHTLSSGSAGYAQCNGCHSGAVDATFLAAKTANFNSALKALGQALARKGFSPNVVDGVLTYPSFTATNWGDGHTGPGNMGAAFNYNMLMRDPGAFAHNPTYVKRLVRDSIDFVYYGSVDAGHDVDAAVRDLLANSTDQADASAFLANVSNGSSACASCHSATSDPVHNDNIVTSYSNSKHAKMNGGAGCADCHLPAGTTGMAHPPQFGMLSSAATIAVNCWNCHTRIDSGFNKTRHSWPSQGICMECHNPHSPWPPSMNISPHFSTYSTAQYITAGAANNNTGITCNNCHFKAGANVFTVYSANLDWAKSSHGDPLGVGYIGRGPYTEANLEATDFKFLGTPLPAKPATTTQNDCVRCHTSTGFATYVTPLDPNDQTTAFSNIQAFGQAGDRTREMVSCPACHYQPSGTLGDSFQRRQVGLPFDDIYGNHLDYAVKTWVGYSSSATRKIIRQNLIADTQLFNPMGDSNICITCHAGKGAGDLIKPITEAVNASCGTKPASLSCRTAGNTGFWTNVDIVDPHYSAPANFILPDGVHPGYEYRTGSLTTPKHSTAGIGTGTGQGPCVECHMTSATPHLFKVLSSASNGTVGGIRSDACGTCHGVGALPALTASTLENSRSGYVAALAIVKAQLQNRGILYDNTRAPYFFQSADPAQKFVNWNVDGKYFGADLMGAAFNLRLLDSDSGWVHNPTYTKRILYDTLDYLDDGIVNSSVTAQSLTAFDPANGPSAAGYLVPRP